MRGSIFLIDLHHKLSKVREHLILHTLLNPFLLTSAQDTKNHRISVASLSSTSLSSVLRGKSEKEDFDRWDSACSPLSFVIAVSIFRASFVRLWIDLDSSTANEPVVFGLPVSQKVGVVSKCKLSIELENILSTNFSVGDHAFSEA